MKAATVLVGTPYGCPPLVTTKTAADARLRANARGRDGGVFAKSCGESSADDKPSRRADSASCAGLGRRVHHSACRSGGHIRACRSSLVASRTTTGRAKRLPAIPILASAMQGGANFILLANVQTGLPPFGSNPENIYSF